MPSFVPPSHTPYPWHDLPQTDTPVNAQRLQASEQDGLTDTRTVVAAYDAFAETQFVHQDGTGMPPGFVLTPVAIQTASYNVLPSQLVPVDLTASSFAINLPNAPADKTVVGVQVNKVASNNTATVTAQGFDVFDHTGGPTTKILGALSQNIFLQYSASGAIWFVRSLDSPLGVPNGAVPLGSTTGTQYQQPYADLNGKLQWGAPLRVADVLDPQFGGFGDTIRRRDTTILIGSPDHVSVAGYTFTNADVGKQIGVVYGTTGGFASFGSTIASVSGGQAVMASPGPGALSSIAVTGDITSGSTVVSNLSGSAPSIGVKMGITGPGIPDDTVLTMTANTTGNLSKLATATTTGTALTLYPGYVVFGHDDTPAYLAARDWLATNYNGGYVAFGSRNYWMTQADAKSHIYHQGTGSTVVYQAIGQNKALFRSTVVGGTAPVTNASWSGIRFVGDPNPASANNNVLLQINTWGSSRIRVTHCTIENFSASALDIRNCPDVEVSFNFISNCALFTGGLNVINIAGDGAIAAGSNPASTGTTRFVVGFNTIVNSVTEGLNIMAFGQTAPGFDLRATIIGNSVSYCNILGIGSESNGGLSHVSVVGNVVTDSGSGVGVSDSSGTQFSPSYAEMRGYVISGNVIDNGNVGKGLNFPYAIGDCTVVATTNQALTGLPTIDTYALQEGDAVLLTGQTIGNQNGKWLPHAGAWTRPSADYATGSRLIGWRTCKIRQGTNAGVVFNSADSFKTIDTDATTWRTSRPTGVLIQSISNLIVSNNTVVASLPFSDLTKVSAGRVDATCATTNGSPVVSDTNINANDTGGSVTGIGIPANTFVGTVTPNVSFRLSSSATSQVDVNATLLTNPVSLTIGGGTTIRMRNHMVTGNSFVVSSVDGAQNMAWINGVDGLTFQGNRITAESEVDWVDVRGATSGTFNLRINDGATVYPFATINWNDTAYAIQSALRNTLPAALQSSVYCTAGARTGAINTSTQVISIYFVNGLGGRPIILTADFTNLTGGTRVITRQITGGTGLYGLELDDTNSAFVSNNHIRNAGKAGMNLNNCRDGVISDNVIFDCNTQQQVGALGSGIIHTGDVGTRLDISGNRIMDRRATYGVDSLMTYGIALQAVTGAGTPVTVRNNTCLGWTAATWLFNPNLASPSDGNLFDTSGAIEHSGQRTRYASAPPVAAAANGAQTGGLPVTINWNVGDTTFNTAPTIGGYAMWLCTAAGAPGTWTGFAARSTVDFSNGQAGLTSPTSRGWRAVNLAFTANRIFFSRFVPGKDMSVVKLRFTIVTAASGANSNLDTVDVGLFSVSGTTLTLMQSYSMANGATAATGVDSTGFKALTIPATALSSGAVYYAGILFGTAHTTACVPSFASYSDGLSQQLYGNTVGLVDVTAYDVGGATLNSGLVIASGTLPSISQGALMGVCES